jgi:photosystem II stability/assembly factor-like uncharacterized protein
LQRVHDISVAGRGDPGLLAVHIDGTVSRSLDGGTTWTSVSVPDGAVQAASGFQSVAGSPHDSRTWYVTAKGGQAYVTRDAGDTWSPTQATVYGLAFGATRDLLYDSPLGVPGSVGTGRVSVDGGNTWRAMGNAPIVVRGVVPSPSDANVVYLWGPGGVVRSDDQGATWRDVTPDMPLGANPLRSLAVDALDPNSIYANAFTPMENATYTSRDGGRTWTRIPLQWIVNTVPDPAVRGRAYAFSFNATVYETRDGGLTWTTVEGAQPSTINPSNSGPPWMRATVPGYIYEPASVAVLDGRRLALTASHSTLASIDLEQGPLALGSDLWWNPQAPGSGLTISQHPSNQVFLVWYTYDADGKQLWRVMPGGTWSDRTLDGTIYETEGPPYFAGPFDPSLVGVRAVGAATLEFQDQDNATLVHEGVRTTITRQLFGNRGANNADNFADLWWSGSEPGWGIGISHQGDRIFATWYVYDEYGEPMWITLPDASVVPEFVGAVPVRAAGGDIYTTRREAGQVVVTKVGTARLRFRDLNTADLEYTAYGKSDTRRITRQPF